MAGDHVETQQHEVAQRDQPVDGVEQQHEGHPADGEQEAQHAAGSKLPPGVERVAHVDEMGLHEALYPA